MSSAAPHEHEIVAAIRRIVRAVDLHSQKLREDHGITAPQLATLAAAQRLEAATISTLARAVHLSQPTVSGILDRLERDRLVRRERSVHDRRSVVIRVTPAGERLLTESPSLLQDRFRAELGRLRDWERSWLLAALQRIAAMMDAEAIDASPYLETGPIRSQSDGDESAPTDVHGVAGGSATQADVTSSGGPPRERRPDAPGTSPARERGSAAR